MERGRSNAAGVGGEGSHTTAVSTAEIERLVEENRRLYEHIGRITHLAWLEEEAERAERDAEEFRRRCEEARRQDEKARAEAERLRREQAEKARRATEEARVREEQRKQREQAEKEAREREARQRRQEEEARRNADEARKEKERGTERKRKAEEEKREAERRARWAEWERRSNLSPRERYEEDWQAIAAGNFGEHLSFARFPWPLLERPGCHHEQEFPVNKIEGFLFLANLKTNAERCQLIRKELTRWHPHMFQTRVLPHLLDWDAQRIYEAAACVSRALVQLHEKFSQS